MAYTIDPEAFRAAMAVALEEELGMAETSIVGHYERLLEERIRYEEALLLILQADSKKFAQRLAYAALHPEERDEPLVGSPSN